MPTTDAELESKKEHVASLRQQVADATAARVERELEAANDVTARQLDAEAVMLESQLQEEKASVDRSLMSATADEALQSTETVVAEPAPAETPAAPAVSTESSWTTPSSDGGV